MNKKLHPVIILLCIAMVFSSGTFAREGRDADHLLYSFEDNAEWHEDFAIDDITGWIMKDYDGQIPAGPFQDYPNKGVPQAFIIYNPSQTSPPNAFPEFQPRSGNKVFMSISSNSGPSNNWMITRELAPHQGGVFSFYAKGTFDFFGNEEFNVGYSFDGTDPEDFTMLHGANGIEANLSWTHYEYTIPAGVKHIAIVSVSYAYCFMVDDISFAPVVDDQSPAAPVQVNAEMNMADGLSIDLTWTNPSSDNAQNELTDLSGIKVFRASHPMDFTEIADLTDVQPGGESSFSDESVQIEEFYAYRLVGYNEHGLGEIYETEFLFLAVETTPGAPHQVVFSRNEQNQTVISWNEVNYGAQGGILQDPVVGYTITRSLGNQSETLASMHEETVFTETDNPDLNLYSYQIVAHTSIDNYGPPAVRNYYTGMEPHQIPVTWGVSESDQVFELTRSSILSQSIYMNDEIGSTGLITSLAYFSNIGSGSPTSNYKIYISKTDRSVFGTTPTNMVWENFNHQKLVYDGPISFSPGRNAVDIVLDQPFFFDQEEGKNLIISVVKPLIENVPPVSNPRFFNTPVDGIRTYYAIGFGVDMSTITTQPANWQTDEVGTIPSIVAGKVTSFGTLTGNVTAGGLENGLEGVTIEISPDTESGAYQTETLITDEQGNYLLPALLPGSYHISFFLEGYDEWETTFEIEGGQHLVLDVVFSDATPVSITGTVTGQDQQPVEGARVYLSGYSSYTGYTDVAGHFTLSAFGEKEYTIEVSHPLYHTESVSLTTPDEDHDIGTVNLSVQPHRPMNVVAELQDSHGHISWEIPYGLTNQTMLEWGSLTQFTAWGWGGAPFTAGVRFTISDLQNMIPADGKLTHVKAFIANNAHIHIEVFEGHNAAELIYTHPETISEPGWYTFELARAIEVDITKELWIGIRFEAGYGPYPIGIDEGPNAPQRKGSMLYENGTWTPMSLTNKNWNIYGIVHNTIDASPEGYSVYRSTTGTGEWSLLTPEPITEETFTDLSLADADPGSYLYGVVAGYGEDLHSEMSISNVLLLDVLFNVSVVLQPNTGNAQGAYISISNPDNFYEVTMEGEAQEVVIENIWLGEYDIYVYLENFEPVEIQSVSIHDATPLEIPLYELTPAPTNLKVDQEPGSSSAVISWTLHAHFMDNLESYPDFEKENIGNFILKDNDGLPTYTYTNFSWPGEGDPMSFMVFNPFATVPPINLDAWSGRRYLVAMAGPYGPSDDWLIIPAGPGSFSFMAQSLVSSDPETFRVLYSTGGSSIADFTTFEGGELITAPVNWTRYSFEAPENTRFMAINYTGNDTYFLMVDDIEYQKEYHHVLSYNVYLDDVLIAENVTDNTFQFTDLHQEFHMAGVEAVFSSGVSEMVTIELEGATSISEEQQEQWITVYPNPSRGIFTVNLYKEATITMYDLNGREVFRKEAHAGSNTINPGLAPGSYALKIRNNQDSKVVRMIIQ